MALKKQVFAAALSHGLDPVVAATWNPDLPRTPRVLVPIQVDALVVRKPGGTWADCRMRSPGADAVAPDDASALLPPPFTDLEAPRPRGVHLHWALPDGLARGASSTPAALDGQGDASAGQTGVTFPAIPNRWLVARIGGGATVSVKGAVAGVSLSRRDVTAWVIESDRAEPQVTPLSQWTEPGPGQDIRKPLTALGHGDPAWSAYYDNVVGRLAFHDALEGVASGPLAYLVCGWYADPTLDPLGDHITSLSQFTQRIKELGWELPKGSYDQAPRAYERVQSAALMGLDTREAMMTPRSSSPVQGGMRKAFSPDAIDAFEGHAQASKVDRLGRPEGGYFRLLDAFWPRYTLCHGSVVALGWPDEGIPGAEAGLLGGQVGGPPPASKVRVAVGHTMTDALAAMLAANNRTPDEARALEAALLGAADELDAPDAAARVDVRVHAASFGSLPGGSVTETVMQRPPTGTPRSRAPRPGQTDLGIFKDVQPKAGPPAPAGGGVQPLGSRALEVKAYADAKLGGVNIRPGRDLAGLIRQFGAGSGGAQAPSAGPAPDPDPVPVPVQVPRALPRYFIPSDPVFLVQGLARSFKHGGDGRFSERGLLPCRVSGMRVEELKCSALRTLPGGGRFRGADVLANPLAHGGVPPECPELLEELALLDPGSATFAARSMVRGDQRLATDQVQMAARAFAVEQTVWWASRDPRRDMAPLAAASGLAGHLPCPIAVSPPARPWVPLHLDWEVEYIDHAIEHWQLGELDFDARADGLPGPEAAGTVLRGRALLTAGAAQTAASAVRKAIERAQKAGGSVALAPRSVEKFHSEMAHVLLTEVSGMANKAHRTGEPEGAGGPLDTDELRSVADALAEMDVLSGAIDRFHTRLRGGFVADGQAAPGPDEAAPAPFVALRAGFMRVRRLRLVDCFGQVLDLAGSSATTPVDMAQLVRSEPMTVQSRPDLLELAPRFTAPTRLMLRFVDAENDGNEAQGDASPVAGYLLPDHLDAELQFHAADGAGLGAVRFDAGRGVQWEDEPGRPASVGASPARAIANRHLAGIAQGLLDWGTADTTRDDPARDTALSALLRVIDTTLWTVDPFGHIGDEHLSLLVGHPVAVLRARLTLEVNETIDRDALATHRVPVRLGALAQWQDGLLGYYVDDDYRTLYLPDPAAAGLARPVGPGVGFLQSANRTSGYYTRFAEDLGVNAVEGATPVAHDFVQVADDGLLMLRPGQTVMLTLLMEPHSQVHATCGLLPRKALGMRREWVARGLAAIAPSFRFGPVMVDPKRIRMPVASELRGSWSWCHRVDATTWQEEEVVNATGDAQLPRDPVMGQEGWLRLNPAKPEGTS